MVNTDSLVEVPLTSSDTDDAQALVAEAGWNQTAADWRIFLNLGRALSARARDGALVGTAATLPYAGGFGWISMLLVPKAWRRQGIGTRLLNRCVETLRELNSILMFDATPAGREVYRRLGFCDVWPITHWRRAAADFGRDATNVRPLEDAINSSLRAISIARQPAGARHAPGYVSFGLLRNDSNSTIHPTPCRHFAATVDATEALYAEFNTTVQHLKKPAMMGGVFCLPRGPFW